MLPRVATDIDCSVYRPDAEQGAPRSGSLPSHNRHDHGGCFNGDPHENPDPRRSGG